jgi:hypothetical protein
VKIGVALVSESTLDLGAFQPAAYGITGQNHVSDVDLNPGFSQLQDHVSILDHFSGNDAGLSQAITFVGFMFAGFEHDIAEIVEYTRGMPHLDTRLCERTIRCTIAVGSLDQWVLATVKGCRSHKMSTARYAFNTVYKLLDQKGFANLFKGFTIKNDDNNTFLLEHK